MIDINELSATACLEDSRSFSGAVTGEGRTYI